MKQKETAVFAALMIAAAACSAPETAGSPEQSTNMHPPMAGGGEDEAPAGAAQGYTGSDAAHLSLRLVDAPTDEVTSIVVTVARVDALLASGWTTLVEQEQTVDLLTLQDGKFLSLGTASLAPGRVGQLRLRLKEGGDHHVVTPDGESHPLSIPSGEASGIKLVGGFDVPPCATGHVTIDFDGKRSLALNEHGKNAGAWSMRPVIRLKAIVTAGECADSGAPPEDGGVPVEDACAAIACSEQELCENGSCRPQE